MYLTSFVIQICNYIKRLFVSLNIWLSVPMIESASTKICPKYIPFIESIIVKAYFLPILHNHIYFIIKTLFYITAESPLVSLIIFHSICNSIKFIDQLLRDLVCDTLLQFTPVDFPMQKWTHYTFCYNIIIIVIYIL